MCDGVSLSAEEIADAGAIGVQEAGRVRLLRVETIPRPSHPPLRAACVAIDFFTPATGGLTLGYGFLFDRIVRGDLSLIVHELVHVA